MKILFISRPCSLNYLITALETRCEVMHCSPYSNGFKNSQLFSIDKLAGLKRALKNHEFDLVIALSHACPIWRNNVPFGRNFWRIASSSLRRSSAFGLRLLLPTIRKHNIPLAVIDDDDSVQIALRNWPLLEASAIYFKMNPPVDLYHAFLYQTAKSGTPHNIRNLEIPCNNLHKIRPCGIGFDTRIADMADELGKQPKTQDIFFTGSMSYSQYREETLPEFLALAEQGVKVDYFRGRLPFEDFLRRCASAHLTWSPHGAGWDNLRNYEASFAHSVAVCTYPNVRRYQPLQQNDHIFMYSLEPGALTKAVLAALAQKEKFAAMTAAARAHTYTHHHPEKIVSHIIEETLVASQKNSRSKSHSISTCTNALHSLDYIAYE